MNQPQLRIGGEHARAQALDESRVDFHCPDAGRALEQTASEKSESRADLDDLLGRREIEQADNRIDHALVNQEILSAAFSRPEIRFAQRCANFFVKGHNDPLSS